MDNYSLHIGASSAAPLSTQFYVGIKCTRLSDVVDLFHGRSPADCLGVVPIQ